jgi:hypothetical protein
LRKSITKSDRAAAEVLKLSATTGEGMAEYLEFLERRRTPSNAAAAVGK